MLRIKERRDIIDRKTLQTAIDDLVGRGSYSDGIRPDVLKCLRKALRNGRNVVRARFEAGESAGAETARALAFLVDQVVRTLHDFAVSKVYPIANPTKGEDFCIAATGGYGRGELAPFSDIDLLFLVPYKRTPRTEQIVEFMLYLLWDLGLKVGHATRSVGENVKLAKGDLTIRTSLLETRHLGGSERLYNAFKTTFWKDVVAVTGRDFVKDKMAERDARHDRMGDSRYVLEPNVKEGKGGLRDLQTLFWMARYLYRVESVPELVDKHVFTKTDAKIFTKARMFLWTVRCHLHYATDRPEERLAFDVQKTIARRMNYRDREGAKAVERFMKHYFLVAKDIGDLTRVLCAVMEEEQNKPRFRLPSFATMTRIVEGFRIDGGRLNFENQTTIDDNPVKIVEIFRQAQKHDIDIHPDALRLVTSSLQLVNAAMRRNARANELFLEILTDPKNAERGLRMLNEAGVLGRFVPDFGRVVAQMQYDMYHVYTVDEHTIRAIGMLNKIERGDLGDVHAVSDRDIREPQSRRALYVAVLLHDIAKGRGGDHSILGAEVALKLCPRLGLSEWETEVVSWLVLEHLSMSRAAFKRDLDDPKTIRDFVGLVQSPERLRLLLVLTVVDIRAVGPNVWNAWKGGLLRDLYYRAQEALSGGIPKNLRRDRIRRARARLTAALADDGWPEADIEKHLSRGLGDYWLSHDAESLKRHAVMIREAEGIGLGLRVEIRVDEALGVTEVVIHTADQPGLFAGIAGAMALAGASIVNARVATMADGMALDTFIVQDGRGGTFDESREKHKKLRFLIEEALAETLRLKTNLEEKSKTAVPSRTDVFKVSPRVIMDNNGSADHTIIELNGRDRPGLLHDIARVLADMSIRIHSAHISTYGFRVVDVFYVKDIFGLKIEQEERLRKIARKLLDAIVPYAAVEPIRRKRRSAGKRSAAKSPNKKPPRSRATPGTTGAANGRPAAE